MVSVPVSNGNARAVQPIGRERFNYAESRNLVGRAVEGFGAQLGETAKVWDEIEATYDEADALRVANEYGAYERERLRTGEKAYLTTQGFNAGDGRESAVTDLRNGAENLLKGARSDRARNMAKRALDTRLGNSETQIAEHAIGQMNVARNEQSQARISGLTTDAIDARGTEQFVVNLGVAEMELGQMGGREGWGDDKIKYETDKLISNTYSRTVLAIDAEDGEPTAAVAFLDQNKGMIAPDEEARLRASLTPRVDQAWASELVSTGALEAYLPGAGEPVEAAAETGGADITLSLPFTGQGTTVAGGRYGANRTYGAHTGVDYTGLPAGTGVPPSAPGTVIKSEFREGYGNRIEVDHGKDAQGRRIVTTYSHLDGRKVEVGDKVDADTVLGGVGSSGGKYGTHLHFEVMVDGQKVDPSTVGEMRVKPGSPGVPADARLNAAAMRTAVDKYVAANPGISEARKQSLYAAADRAVDVARSDRAQGEQDADRRVMDWLTKNKADPDSLTSVSQIPAAVLAGASPSTLASLSDRVQATSDRIQSRNDAAAKDRADAIEEAAVFELYTLTDDDLATTDLRKYAGVIPLKKLGPWVDRQQKAADGGAASKSVSTDRIAGKVDSLGKAYGADRGPQATEEQRKAWIDLRGYVEQRVAGRPNKDVSDEELRAIVIAGMTEVEVKNTGIFRNDRTPRSQLAPGTKYVVEVPSTVSAEIRANLRTRLGREPHEDEVWETYNKGKARGVYE